MLTHFSHLVKFVIFLIKPIYRGFVSFYHKTFIKNDTMCIDHINLSVAIIVKYYVCREWLSLTIFSYLSCVAEPQTIYCCLSWLTVSLTSCCLLKHHSRLDDKPLTTQLWMVWVSATHEWQLQLVCNSITHVRQI
jgi:hypothetical protein